MADNIKIIGNILNTTTISRYSTEDINLMSSRNIQENFGGPDDYIEFYVYDIGGNLLNVNYNYLNYKLPPSTGLIPGVSTPPNTTGEIQTTNVGIESTLAPTTSSLYPIIEIDPVQNIQDLGYSSGEFNVRYNFFQNKISNDIDEALFVKEISQDRTEIRLASNILTDDEIEVSANSIIEEINGSDYYVDYLLNFGNNEQYVAVNIALNKAPEGYEILFKLYQPLPLSVQEKQTLWVVEEKVAPYVFDINLDKFIIPPPPPTLRGPNFDIEIPNQGTVSTAYNNYSNLVNNLQSLQQNSYYQILNLLATQSIDINVDYTDFGNFTFFGSAYQKLYNFYNKIKEIEDYNNFISSKSPQTSSIPSLITEINQYSSSISNIISKFDGYESYLYFESGTYSWPKVNSTKPFVLESTGSGNAIAWYGLRTTSASLYDLDNYNNLEYAVPEFIKNDENNQPFLTFLNMVGHYFDNIWIYLKSITDVNLANNNLEVGISKDLVYDRLKSLGVHLYNSQAGEDVSQYLVGANTGSSTWDNNTSLTGSYLNNVPRKDIVAELYKRIYHNLPLLLKQKGTVAGLENLITTFGIPSKPYESANGGPCALYEVYVSDTSVDSELDLIYCGEILPRNWVTPPNLTTPTFTDYIWVDTSYPITISAGSAVTLTLVDTGDTTILNVKEFGGSLKTDLLKGYNNDKVRIVDNSIVSNTIYSGSVLSPFHSLQTYPTASSQFRENDMHYVDISFSPQTQIDTYISGAISSNNPTWSLDDYIGDPRQQYSPTYPDLDTQRKLYFETGVSGYAPFTASALDYNGFIRLIQYFDNSLFKMLVDFVPERASLSTGVTINSPVLERNKVSYANPTSTTTQSVYDANYEISTISSQYGTFYNALSLSNNTMGWYDGEISGSTVNVYQYFTDNYNPYLLGNTSSYNAWHPADQQINTNTFLHSDWNVLLNNVSKSVTSQFRQRIEYFWGTTSSVLLPAELQDSYLSLRSYNISRYEGSKTTSQLYNTYTSGDDSYGKTAAIDHTVRKIGLFTQIVSSSYLPRRNAVILKYLVDEFGNLTELNKINKNWCDIQRTFLAGKTSAVSLFDNRKFSNQKSTDGTKPIFDSGYLYSPILYFGTCATDPTLAFQTNGTPSSFTIRAQNFSSSYYISGSTTLGYPVSGGIGGAINNIFNFEQEDPNSIYTPGTFNTPPTYSVQETAPHKVYANVDLYVSASNNTTINTVWALQLYSGSTLLTETSKTVFLTPSVTASNVTQVGNVKQASSILNFQRRVTSTKPILLGTENVPAGTDFYYWGNLTTASDSTCPPPSSTNFNNVYSRVAQSNGSYPWVNQPCFSSYPYIPWYGFSVQDFWSIPDFESDTISSTTNFIIDKGYTTPTNAISVISGDQLYLKLALKSGVLPSNYTASLSQGSLTIGSLSAFTGYAITNCPPAYLTTGSSDNELVLSSGISSFYDSGYTFVPNPASGSASSSLYSTYGDVDYPLVSKEYDTVLIYLSDGTYLESRIINIYLNSNNKITLVLDIVLSQFAKNDIQNNTYKHFLLLTRIEDETNAYLTFNKRPGPTSYGFLIPENLAKDVLDNIDTITSQVKTKLVNDQGSIITDINGGGF